MGKGPTGHEGSTVLTMMGWIRGCKMGGQLLSS